MHQTNLHLHYDIPYLEQNIDHTQTETGNLAGEKHVYASFFSEPPYSSIRFLPKDPTLHKPLNLRQVMDRKLRWVTLGGQYDWTEKRYPVEKPPEFPDDIARLLSDLFPDMEAQAGIVNLYSPGDTLSVHRDVSEECDRGLVSISLGCDAVFMVGTGTDPSDEEAINAEPTYLAIRLRSGDAVYMSGKSRFAWHGVPNVIPGTCPRWMEDWPATKDLDGQTSEETYREWKGWMSNKRINLNIRQMRDLRDAE